MFEGVVSADSINYLLVFAEGLLSFFSPCVVPLIPIYMGYLAGGAKERREDGTVTYRRGPVFLHTLFFVLGVSFAFFLLGFSFTQLGSTGFFNQHKALITRISGIIILLFGLLQVGILELPFLKKERKVRLKLNPAKMNPLWAFAMGFTFSFAWTPCVGPMLSSVLLLASSAQDRVVGYLLVGLYTLGFVIPFLALGLFTTQVLNFLKSRRNLLKYAIKVGGVILIIMGVMTFTGWLNGISSYLSSISGGVSPSPQSQEREEPASGDEAGAPAPGDEAEAPAPGDEAGASAPGDEADTQSQQPAPEEAEIIPAFDFTLTDQYGNTHTLSDYKGKVVFLNFWATWCGPCKLEMPHIQALYEEYGGDNQGEVVFLGVANPKSDEHPYNNDVTQPEVEQYLEDNGLTFPVVFDHTAEVFMDYRISSFPTTFMIDKEGNLFGYISGSLSKEMMENIIQQTLDGRRSQ